MAKKKITVKMLNDLNKGKIDFERFKDVAYDLADSIREMKEKGETELPIDFIAPINPEEDDDVLYALGSAMAISLRISCTDAAWKQVANEWLRDLKYEKEE